MQSEAISEPSPKAPVWVPAWYWPFVVIAGFLIVGFEGLNPHSAMAAGFWCGILTGVIFGIGSLIFRKVEDPRQRLYLIIACGILANLLYRFIQDQLNSILPQELLTQLILGASFAAIAGKIVHVALRKRVPRYSAVCFWICTAFGAVGGLVMGLPVALILAIIGLMLPRSPQIEVKVAHEAAVGIQQVN